MTLNAIGMCVCVCMCVCARARAHVCDCASIPECASAHFPNKIVLAFEEKVLSI